MPFPANTRVMGFDRHLRLGEEVDDRADRVPQSLDAYLSWIVPDGTPIANLSIPDNITPIFLPSRAPVAEYAPWHNGAGEA